MNAALSAFDLWLSREPEEPEECPRCGRPAEEHEEYEDEWGGTCCLLCPPDDEDTDPLAGWEPPEPSPEIRDQREQLVEWAAESAARMMERR